MYCRVLQGHSAIPFTFIKLPFVFYTFVLSIFGGRFRQVLLYILVCFKIAYSVHKLKNCKCRLIVDTNNSSFNKFGALSEVLESVNVLCIVSFFKYFLLSFMRCQHFNLNAIPSYTIGPRYKLHMDVT